MKRTELVRILESMGCVLVRHGANHDRYQNPSTKVSQPSPHDKEIPETLAKHIIKMLG